MKKDRKCLITLTFMSGLGREKRYGFSHDLGLVVNTENKSMAKGASVLEVQSPT